MKGKRILIVDDQVIIRKVLERSLMSAGYSVTTAENGLLAVEQLEQNKFDAMITDIMMPKMDGISLLVESRKSYPEMPVLIITGYSKELTAPKARQLGAAELLVKPFKNGEITIALQRALASRQQAPHKSLN